MTDDRRILLIEPQQGRMSELGTRMRDLGFAPAWARSAEDALAAVADPAQRIGAAVIPPDLPVADMAEALTALRRRSQHGALPVIAEGPHPGERAVARLRKAGLDLGLWAPYDDVMLRFQLNRALADGERVARRRGSRVPSGFAARVAVRGRAKEATLYSLSESGAYVETPRPTLPGARIELVVPRLAGDSPIPARVVFTNVPGNLQRANLALGMAVAFAGLTQDVARQIQRYVEDRARAIAL